MLGSEDIIVVLSFYCYVVSRSKESFKEKKIALLTKEAKGNYRSFIINQK